MNPNAFIVDWTMDDYAGFQRQLASQGFVSEPEGDTNHIRVSVPFEQVDSFATLCQQHLNAPHNYVDIQYPDQKLTVLIFQQQTFIVSKQADNEQAKAWALALGLPPEQADWATSF